MESTKMNLKLEEMKRPTEEWNKAIEILKRIEQHYHDNGPLIKAVDNKLFLHILAAIELLPPNLKFTNKPFRYHKDKTQMKDTLRYDINLPSGVAKPLVWVKFPKGKNEYNSVECWLQKYAYTSPKVKPPHPTDNHKYPRFTVHDFSEIDEIIKCLEEVIL